MTVEEIKQVISELPGEARRSLATWLNELDHDDWDKEMARDFSPGGRGYHLLETVKSQLARGEARPLEEGLAERDISRS
jgi:hypothetical protein